MTDDFFGNCVMGGRSVKTARERCSRFFFAEEVPRWFGLSLVLIYLMGLGAVGYFGIRQARKESATHLEGSRRYAVHAMMDRLCDARANHAGAIERKRAYQRELYRFAANVEIQSLRVVDADRHVLASIHPMDVGSIVIDELEQLAAPTEFEVTTLPIAEDGSTDRLFRFPLEACGPLGSFSSARPISSVEPEQGDPSQSSSFAGAVSSEYVEARFSARANHVSDLVDQAESLTVVLVALGSLFVCYRCLRSQLRGVSRIAGRLQAHRTQIEQNLAHLRVVGTFDGVTAAWNELIELTQRLVHTVERNEADTELSHALARSSGGALAEALNAVPDGIIFITDEVRFDYLNSMAYRLMGWSAQEAKETSLPQAEASGAGKNVLDVLRKAQRADGSFENHTALVHGGKEAEESTTTYRLWVIPMHREHHDGECVLIIRDVSQQIRAESAREEFVTQVTHELRTPLTNIRAYAETLSSGMFDDPKVITECYNVITKETRRLSRLIEDILSVSQLEVGSIELKLETVDLRATLGDAVRDVRGLADAKNIDMQLVLPAKMEPIRADRDKLAVVLNNLLANAIKYTPADGNVVVACQFTGGEVVVTFKDNGIGIDPSDHARIFEKFQRGNDPDVQNETGTGIGLFTAREIVRRHGGDIDLLSQKGEGSTFSIRLPHQESRASAMTTAKRA